ncbi:MAG: hypothetical protein ACREOZ_04175 [Gloeomargaritales cyanobacterium]
MFAILAKKLEQFKKDDPKRLTYFHFHFDEVARSVAAEAVNNNVNAVSGSTDVTVPANASLDTTHAFAPDSDDETEGAAMLNLFAV